MSRKLPTMIEFIAANWPWIVLIAAMLAMPRGGGAAAPAATDAVTPVRTDTPDDAGRAHHRSHRWTR